MSPQRLMGTLHVGVPGSYPLAFSPAHAPQGSIAQLDPHRPAQYPTPGRGWHTGHRPGSLLSGMLLPPHWAPQAQADRLAWVGLWPLRWWSRAGPGGAPRSSPTRPTLGPRAGLGRGSGLCPREEARARGLAGRPAPGPLGLPAQPPHAPASDAPPERTCDADAAAPRRGGGRGGGGANVRAGRAGTWGRGRGGSESPSRRPPARSCPSSPAGPGDRGPARKPGNPGDPSRAQWHPGRRVPPDPRPAPWSWPGGAPPGIRSAGAGQESRAGVPRGVVPGGERGIGGLGEERSPASSTPAFGALATSGRPAAPADSAAPWPACWDVLAPPPAGFPGFSALPGTLPAELCPLRPDLGHKGGWLGALPERSAGRGRRSVQAERVPRRAAITHPQNCPTPLSVHFLASDFFCLRNGLIPTSPGGPGLTHLSGGPPGSSPLPSAPTQGLAVVTSEATGGQAVQAQPGPAAEQGRLGPDGRLRPPVAMVFFMGTCGPVKHVGPQLGLLRPSESCKEALVRGGLHSPSHLTIPGRRGFEWSRTPRKVWMQGCKVSSGSWWEAGGWGRENQGSRGQGVSQGSQWPLPFDSNRPRAGELAGPLCLPSSPFRSCEEAGAGWGAGEQWAGAGRGGSWAEGRPQAAQRYFPWALSCGWLPASSGPDLTMGLASCRL